MKGEVFETEEDKIFAEKCRIALEKSCGMPFSKPNFSKKKDRFYSLERTLCRKL